MVLQTLKIKIVGTLLQSELGSWYAWGLEHPLLFLCHTILSFNDPKQKVFDSIVEKGENADTHIVLKFLNDWEVGQLYNDR